ncbi:MAG TPA: response regulator [Thermoanaerobaculia bacterium]|nr:response regulator [Thermoanaerobaculia bacterium]
MASDEPKVSILLVDDSPEKLLTLSVILAELGPEIVEASSGREALRHLLSQEFAVILLDVNMPGLDGFETAALIRQRKSSEQTPIIFITAFADDTHVAQGYSLGAVDYIVAPVVPEVLKSKVAVFIELFRKTEQIKRQAKALRHRADQLHRLTETSLAVNSALSLDQILEVVTETARELSRADEAVTIVSADPMSPKLRLAVSLSDAVAADRERAAAEAAMVSAILAGRDRTVRLCGAEVLADPAWAPLAAAGPDGLTPARLSAALSGREGLNMGWIHLACRTGDFTPEDEAILTQLAQMASIAIENTLFSEARESNRLKDEFLATLSHELRTPLTAIVGWTRILRTTPYEEARFGRGLTIIERNVAAQARLIEDLLDISRIIAGKLHLNVRPVALGPAVESAVDAMRPAAEAKGLSIHLAMAPGIPPEETLVADPDRLQQVLWNLLANGIKFTPAGGRIDVSLERRQGAFEIRVSDTGKGIDPLFLHHVFDRFRQDDSSTTRSHGGLGIGLAIVRHIVELQGGRVKAESPGLGKGATFTVTLPTMPPAALAWTPAAMTPTPIAFAVEEGTPLADEPAARAVPSRADLDLKDLYVLLVEDEPDAREVLGEILESAGARVVAAGSLQEAMERLEEGRPAVLVSDIAMPGGDGYALIRQVREHEAAAAAAAETAASPPVSPIPPIPAVAVSAYAREEDRRRALRAGFERYLTKPVEPTELIAVVAKLGRRDALGRPPAAVPEPGPAAAPPAVQGDRPKPCRRVLLVEDDADSREALKTLLELNGYAVDVADNGLQGVERAINLRPDIAVVDIALPEMDGYEVARRIRAQLGSNTTFLIALTGYTSESDRERSLEAGFDAHLGKPVDIERLYRLLDHRGEEAAASPGHQSSPAAADTAASPDRADRSQR